MHSHCSQRDDCKLYCTVTAVREMTVNYIAQSQLPRDGCTFYCSHSSQRDDCKISCTVTAALGINDMTIKLLALCLSCGMSYILCKVICLVYWFWQSVYIISIDLYYVCIVAICTYCVNWFVWCIYFVILYILY